MSVEAVRWVLNGAPQHGGPARAVATALAWHHTPEGGAFPSRHTLVAETCLGYGTVGRALCRLEADGTIRREGCRPGGGTVVWRFPFEARSDQSGRSDRCRRSDQTGATVRPETDNGPTTLAADKKEKKDERIGSPVVSGRDTRARSRTAPTPGPWLDDLDGRIVGVLQRGIDGLTNDEPNKRPTREAIAAARSKHPVPDDVAYAAAVEARVIAQSQNRAPNIAALYEQQLAKAEAVAA